MFVPLTIGEQAGSIGASIVGPGESPVGPASFRVLDASSPQAARIAPARRARAVVLMARY
jgi:hypothetical protein